MRGDRKGHKAIDRRVVRTRAKLHDALLSLLQKKSYEAITVEDICAKGKVGRSTFYAHYTSKDDLIRGQLKNLREMLLARRRNAAAKIPQRKGLAFSAIMLEHARDHIHLHRSLLGNRGGSIAFGMIRQIICDLVRDEFAAADRNGKDAAPREMVVEYVVGAYMAVLNWWLDGGAKLAPQQVDALFQRLTVEGISARE